MSIRILDPDSGATFYLNEFFGGTERGRCHQITTRDGDSVQLTRSQMFELCVGFLKHVQQQSAA
jgi:hypothetical protein